MFFLNVIFNLDKLKLFSRIISLYGSSKSLCIIILYKVVTFDLYHHKKVLKKYEKKNDRSLYFFQTTQYLTVIGFISNGYILCFVLFISTMLQLTFNQFQAYLAIRQGLRVKTGLQVFFLLKLSGNLFYYMHNYSCTSQVHVGLVQHLIVMSFIFAHQVFIYNPIFFVCI